MVTKKECLVTIILPIYNTENFLNDCIDSILAQTFMEFELILIDDGSTDASGIIVDDYVKIDERVRGIHTENLGVSAARYRGLQEARGEYICFADSDDLLHKNLLEILMHFSYKEDAELVVCDYLQFLNDKEIGVDSLNKLNEEISCSVHENYSEVIQTIPITPWGKLYKKNLFDRLDFGQYQKHLPNWFMDDCFFVPQIANNANKIVIVDSKLYYYRVNIESLTRTRELREYHLETYKAKKIMLDFWCTNNYEKEYRLALREYGNFLIKTYMALYYAKNFDKGRKNILQKQIIREYNCIYSLIYNNAFTKSTMRLSFKIFHISPILWRVILGGYYKKHYNCSGSRKG